MGVHNEGLYSVLSATRVINPSLKVRDKSLGYIDPHKFVLCVVLNPYIP